VDQRRSALHVVVHLVFLLLDDVLFEAAVPATASATA
jgi:hypothetical protein